jgi:hypothetical protein
MTFGMSVGSDVERVLAVKFSSLFPHLDERQRRLLVGAEARALGHGGIGVVARAAGVSTCLVSKGLAEIRAGVEPISRVRHRGGGRKAAGEAMPGLVETLLELVGDSTRGGPRVAVDLDYEVDQVPGSGAGQIGFCGLRVNGWKAAAG